MTGRLAEMYEKGLGVTADSDRAAKLRLEYDKYSKGGETRFTVPAVEKSTGRSWPAYIYITDYDVKDLAIDDDPLKSQELDLESVPEVPKLLSFSGFPTAKPGFWNRFLEDREYVIAPETIKSFKKVFKIAKENNTSFRELCIKTLGKDADATDTAKDK